MKYRPYKYMAYGSNMNMDQMAGRCPSARISNPAWIMLKDYRLVFKTFADIIPAKGMSVPVALWDIIRGNEETLDRYESFNPKRPNEGFYKKLYWGTPSEPKAHKFMAYVMTDRYDHISPPSEEYFQSVLRGYEDFGIDPAPLWEALDYTIKNDTGKSRLAGSPVWG
ncbi:MAG: gamma-glutamylcyclotransferase [Parcubacteria group bacterium]|nr:gamma-glutamylcyclotransferase [Parcubacteria group bacterium]|tara:strand:+ start:586 stop:1086 length:501 start_codon:yes stop_codon:yes gene_type:complete